MLTFVHVSFVNLLTSLQASVYDSLRGAGGGEAPRKMEAPGEGWGA
jgi:hypothetical protein